MRNMSFFHTTRQIRNRTKTVTRRLGWANLEPGDRFRAIVKGQGLKKGEKVERLAVLECVSNTPEPLFAITPNDVVREGFPAWTTADFVGFFCRSMRVPINALVNRIEFEYIDTREGES